MAKENIVLKINHKEIVDNITRITNFICDLDIKPTNDLEMKHLKELRNQCRKIKEDISTIHDSKIIYYKYRQNIKTYTTLRDEYEKFPHRINDELKEKMEFSGLSHRQYFKSLAILHSIENLWNVLLEYDNEYTKQYYAYNSYTLNILNALCVLTSCKMKKNFLEDYKRWNIETKIKINDNVLTELDKLFYVE